MYLHNVRNWMVGETKRTAEIYVLIVNGQCGPTLAIQQKSAHYNSSPVPMDGCDISEYIGDARFEQELNEWDAANPSKVAKQLRWEHEQAKKTRQMEAEITQGGRACFVRFGTLPALGKSYNHRDGHYEDGVSVYAAFQVDKKYVLDLRNVDAASALFIVDCAAAYEVTGEICGRGTDGEPLLANCTAKKIRKTTKIERMI